VATQGTPEHDPAPGESKSRGHFSRADFERQMQETRTQFEQASEKIEARAGRNLIFAVGIGLVLGIVLLASLIFIKELFMVIAGLAVGFAVLELVSALRSVGRRIPRIPSVAVAVAMIPAAYYAGADGRWVVIIVGSAVVVLWRLVEAAVPSRRVSGRELAKDLGTAVFVQLYVTLLGSFSILLVAQPDGQWWTLAFLIVVVVTDIGAYASGVLFGKHPMAPAISPKKTWEGFAGAGTAAIIAGVLLSIFMLHDTWWLGVIMGIVLLGTATLGDLGESLIKRDIGVKDMSSWIPGHGGLLDRLDSILPSAAAAYALFLIFH
jgi:phosphatidate cytidylyltransferase